MNKERRNLLAWLRSKRRGAELMLSRSYLYSDDYIHRGRAKAFHEVAKYVTKTWPKKKGPK